MGKDEEKRLEGQVENVTTLEATTGDQEGHYDLDASCAFQSQEITEHEEGD